MGAAQNVMAQYSAVRVGVSYLASPDVTVDINSHCLISLLAVYLSRPREPKSPLATRRQPSRMNAISDHHQVHGCNLDDYSLGL